MHLVLYCYHEQLYSLGYFVLEETASVVRPEWLEIQLSIIATGYLECCSQCLRYS